MSWFGVSGPKEGTQVGDPRGGIPVYSPGSTCPWEVCLAPPGIQPAELSSWICWRAGMGDPVPTLLPSHHGLTTELHWLASTAPLWGSGATSQRCSWWPLSFPSRPWHIPTGGAPCCAGPGLGGMGDLDPTCAAQATESREIEKLLHGLWVKHCWESAGGCAELTPG